MGVTKKKLAIITISEKTNQLFKQQLEKVLKNKVNIKSYIIEEIADQTVEADLILSTKSLMGEIDNYVADPDKIIFARRSLDISSLEQLIKLPSNKKALLINNTQLAAFEAKDLLTEVGVDHIDLIPFYPGKGTVDKVDLAINLGEDKYVPDNIERVINIGSRVLDLTTIIEILINLNLLDDKSNLLSSRYIRELVKLSRRLDTNMKNKARINKKLDAIINHVHDGIIYINQQEEIEVFNEMAEEIFEMDAENVIGRKVDQTIPNTKLDKVLSKDIKHINAIQNIGDKKIVSTRVPVKEEGEIVGALATFKDVTDVKELEEDLRRKLKKKGYIAKYNFSDIVGKSQELKKTIKKAKKLSKSESTVLIQGESGTGKELFAHSIHNYSERSKAPFVVINCAALPDNLLESELFGYEEGAFTGAKKGGKPGVFEQAHTGTIFLDEIGDISPSIQSRLLRVLQEKEVMRVGGTKVIPIDIRVITATNKNIQRLVNEGKFREDLYYRLNVLSLQLPPLRRRREDIPLLIDYFLEKFGREDLSLSKKVVSRLYNYNWKGNIRELENCIEYIVQICEDKVEIDNLPSHFNPKQNNQKQDQVNMDFELDELGDIKEYIFILNELYLAKQLDDNIGRREISKNAEINNLYLSPQMVRSRLNKLEEHGLVNIGKGRQGTKITNKGIKVLKELGD